MNSLRWVAAAALSALACQLAVVHSTPIDRALPFLAVLTTVLAALSYPSIMLGVPLLILAEIALPDEGMRLLAFGVVLAGVFLGAVGGGNDGTDRTDRTDGTDGTNRQLQGPIRPIRPIRPISPIVPLLTILLLRWIPFTDVLLARELFLLALALVIFLVLDSTPFAMAVAVLTALVTPAVPLRTLALPILVLLVAVAARTFGLPRIVLAWPSRVVVAFAILFFAWSGVVARAFPYFLRRAAQPGERTVVAQALGPGRAAMFDVPHGARSIIVSGANVARLRRGVVLGRVEPGALEIRIGDAADWGFLRREQFHDARNPFPRDPAGRIRGYGYAAWLDGAGRVALPAGVRQIRVVADAGLPADASLQVEGFE